MTSMDSLLGALLGVPALPGAKCRGRWRLFDEQHPGESDETAVQRHKQALSLCSHCPSLNPCRDWFDRLKPSRRPSGVIAGRLHRHGKQITPRKETQHHDR